MHYVRGKPKIFFVPSLKIENILSVFALHILKIFHSKYEIIYVELKIQFCIYTFQLLIVITFL